MVYRLDEDIEENKFHYYFSLLTDRFEPLNALWIAQLEKKFGKKFKPIYVLPSKHNKLFAEDNYIVLNHRQTEMQRSMGRKKITLLIYPEDLNKQFSRSKFIKNLTEKLLKKQDKLFILSFTNVWLKALNEKVVLLGPKAKIAEKFDNKMEHIKVFEELGLPVINTEVYESFDDLLSKRKKFPFYISAAYSSGGFESKPIFTYEDLETFYTTLRPVNKKGSFSAADFLENIVLAPNTSAIITGANQTKMVCISDQVLRGNRYMGNIYPSNASKKFKEIMTKATIKLGNYLSRHGYRGLFGCDFMITKKGECFIGDLNPRRQGGYFCNAMMSRKVNLIELEFRVALGDELPPFDFEDFQVDYCWAHSKIVPYLPNIKIVKEFEKGEFDKPFREAGQTYQAIYYPKGSILIIGNPGFYMTSGNTYAQVKRRMLKDVEKTISCSFKLYD